MSEKIATPLFPNVRLALSQTYNLIRVRRQGDVAVYRSSDGMTYLRTGDRETLLHDLDFHKALFETGFPVAHVEHVDLDAHNPFYCESSLGEHPLIVNFSDETNSEGVVADSTYKAFKDVSVKWLHAQLALGKPSADVSASRDSFRSYLRIEEVIRELPERAEEIEHAFLHVSELLAQYPESFCHGDYNPYNVFPSGAIDFERSFHGPVVWDVFSALALPYMYPEDTNSVEHRRGYKLKPEQQDDYCAAMDAMLHEYGLIPASTLMPYVVLLFTMHKITHMSPRAPRLKQFRIDLLAHQLSNLFETPQVPRSNQI